MDRDKIELPPEWLTIPAIQAWADARARDAVIAALDLRDERTAELTDELRDLNIELARCRKERDAARAEQAKPAEPEVHRAHIYCTRESLTWRTMPTKYCAHVILCWTNDGRAWIESEHNRELAKELRRLYSAGASIHCLEAADALDGGVR